MKSEDIFKFKQELVWPNDTDILQRCKECNEIMVDTATHQCDTIMINMEVGQL